MRRICMGLCVAIVIALMCSVSFAGNGVVKSSYSYNLDRLAWSPGAGEWVKLSATLDVAISDNPSSGKVTYKSTIRGTGVGLESKVEYTLRQNSVERQFDVSEDRVIVFKNYYWLKGSSKPYRSQYFVIITIDNGTWTWEVKKDQTKF